MGGGGGMGGGGRMGAAPGQAQQGDQPAQAPTTQGQQRGFGGGGGRDGFMGDGDGPGGNFNGGFGNQPGQQQESNNNALTAGISLLVIILSCIFVAFYKRKRL